MNHGNPIGFPPKNTPEEGRVFGVGILFGYLVGFFWTLSSWETAGFPLDPTKKAAPGLSFRFLGGAFVGFQCVSYSVRQIVTISGGKTRLPVKVLYLVIYELS